MDWLCMSVPCILGVVSCLVFSLLPPAHAHALRSRSFSTAAKRTGTLKRNPGGTSRGGSSASRDELRNRLRAYRRSHLKEFGGVYDPGSQGPMTTVNPPPCSLQNPDDIQRIIPGRFLSEEELMRTVPGTKTWVSDSQQESTPFTSQRRFVPPSASQLERDLLQQQQQQQQQQQEQQQQQQQHELTSNRNEQHAAFNIKSDGLQSIRGDALCTSCLTEIGYEIMEYIVDFTGQNHTVINFKNAYQFIPSGRCVNEHSPCGPLGWQCRQVTRAHWTLVWTAGVGVNLVAHEVPSHCQCLNLGLPLDTPLRSAAASVSASSDTLHQAGPAQAESHAGGFGWAGMNIDHANGSTGPPYTSSNSVDPYPPGSSDPDNPSIQPTGFTGYPVSQNPFTEKTDPYFVSRDENPVSSDPYYVSSVHPDQTPVPNLKNSQAWDWGSKSSFPSTVYTSSSFSSWSSSSRSENPSPNGTENSRITFS